MIHVDSLTKTYRVQKRAPGLSAALKALFHREYENVQAVKGIGFDIAPGERVGFLGPNGAGKTTTLKMLSGLLHPTSGTATVDGHTPRRRESAFLRKVTLVMGQKQQLLWDLPPADTFELNRAIYDIPKREYDETLEELVRLLELQPLIGKPARQLSLGERMKCELAAALLHRPKVLFLDEPTIGLDVSMQATVRSFVRAYNERFGATVLLTSHYMDDVAALCPRVIIIDHGTLRYDGSLADLVRKVRPDKRIQLRLSKVVERRDLENVATVISAKETDALLQVPSDGLPETVNRLLATLPVADLSITDPPLEEVFRELYQQGDVLANGSGR